MNAGQSLVKDDVAPPVRIGAVEPQHAQLVRDLAALLHIEDGHPLSEQAREAASWLAHGEPLAPAWLAWSGDVAVGYLVLALGYSVEYGGPVGYIDDLYVVPDARGRGIGQHLLRLAIDEARARDLVALHLEVEPGNVRAEALYAEMGFETSTRRTMNMGLRRSP
jgi:ribosomal protein S18 acetylase RimI-like enzyme